MEKCCHNPYYDCERWLGCSEELAIRVPNSYTEAEITLRFGKWIGRNIYVSINVMVSNGWAVVGLEYLPQGFLNPYAGAYTLEFLDGNGIVIPFIAKNGETYYSASFDFMSSSQVEAIAQLNFIDNQVY